MSRRSKISFFVLALSAILTSTVKAAGPREENLSSKPSCRQLVIIEGRHLQPKLNQVEPATQYANHAQVVPTNWFFDTVRRGAAWSSQFLHEELSHYFTTTAQRPVRFVSGGAAESPDRLSSPDFVKIFVRRNYIGKFRSARGMSSARVNRFISSLRATAIEAFSEFPKGEGMADYRDAVGYLHQDVFNLQQFAELARRSESAISKRIEREFPIVYRTKNALGPSATWLSYGVSTRGVNHAAVAANSRVFRQDPNEIVSNYDDPKIRESIRELLISTEQKREQMVQMIFSTFGGNSKITTRLLKPEVRFGVEVWVPSVELNGKFETVEALRSFFVRRLKVAQVSDELLKLIFEYSKQARAFERPNDFNQDEMTVLNTSESDLGISKQRRSQDDAALSKMDFIFDGESVGAKKTHECEAQLAALTQQSSNVDPDWIIDHLSHGDVIQRMRARQKETRRLVEKHFQNRILPRSAKDAEDHTGDESAIHLAEVPEWQDISTFFAEFEPGDRFMAVSNITLDGRSIVPLEERSDLREVAETISKMAKAEVLDRGISQIDPDGGAEIQIGVEVLPVRIERGGVKYDVNIYWKSFGRMTSEQRDELEALSSPQFLRSALNSRMDQRWADGLQGVNMIIVN